MPQIVRYIGWLSLYSWVFSSFLLAQGGSGSLEAVQRALAGRASVALAASRDALGHGLHLTFWGVLAVAVATLALALLVPHVEVRRRRA
jgi:hypothetical protein